MNWRQALPTLLLGAVAIAVTQAVVPIGGLGALLWPLLVSGLVVFFHVRRRGRPLRAGQGARLGAAMGVAAFVISFTVSLVTLAVIGKGKFLEAMRAQLEAQSMNADPAAAELVERLLTPEGVTLLVLLGGVVMLAVFLLFSAVGGALGASLAGKPTPPAGPAGS